MKKKKPAKARVSTTVSRSAAVSFRIERGLLAKIDTAASAVGVARNRLVALVMAKYITDRGADGLAQLVREGAPDVDLFG